MLDAYQFTPDMSDWVEDFIKEFNKDLRFAGIDAQKRGLIPKVYCETSKGKTFRVAVMSNRGNGYVLIQGAEVNDLSEPMMIYAPLAALELYVRFGPEDKEPSRGFGFQGFDVSANLEESSKNEPA